MIEPVQSHRCGRPQCEVSKTGICLEGNSPPETCPFFGQTAPDELMYADHEEEIESGSMLQATRTDRVSLPSGDALSQSEVNQFLLWKPARFVAIVGDFDSGKTTLICAIYDKFLRGAFAGYLFGGSRTLTELEQKIHHSRIDSGRVIPDTMRTPLSEGPKYFHFSLVSDGDVHSRVELMLADRAGEQYQQARNNSAVVPELIEVKNAHYIALLMDGGRIAEPISRAGAMQSVRQTLRALLDGGGLSKDSRVQVVTTKFDELAKIADNKEFNAQLEQFRNNLLKDFSDRVGELTFWEVAARDPQGKFPLAFGVDKLLSKWCASIPTTSISLPSRIPLTTEFDRLLSRTPMGEVL